ncbi:MAG: hypothetical protein UW71_C0031G0002 [Parcubacteria group bacterium GW2011_GWB1_44_7]|nr:MAG: hypothetical protein UW71_C0031G0002 [Parcubacteria group bacterium GW2011_GWB1_44_7]
MEKINGNEILGSIHEAIKERFFSPFYGTFIISWLIFHWKFVYTAFFVSEEKIWESAGLLKNDYLSETFFDFSSLHFYISWILPFVLTYLIIWRFPKWISIPAFREDLDNITKKQKMLITAEKEFKLKGKLRKLPKKQNLSKSGYLNIKDLNLYLCIINLRLFLNQSINIEARLMLQIIITRLFFRSRKIYLLFRTLTI